MPEIMNCPLCGKEIDMSEEQIFCENCGQNLLAPVEPVKPRIPIAMCSVSRESLLDRMTEPVPPVDPISNEAEVVQSSAPEEFEKPSMSASKTYHYDR